MNVNEPSYELSILLLLLILPLTQTHGIGNHQLHNLDNNLIYDLVGLDVFFEIVDPPELEYTYRLRPAKDFGAPFNESFSEKGIALVPYEPATACVPAKNAAQIKGKVALVERGKCTFHMKSIMAEAAGARAVIVADYHPVEPEAARKTPIWTDYYYIDMVVDDSASELKAVNIPAGFLLGKNGLVIKQTLKRLNLEYALINIPVNLTFAPLNQLNQPPWHSW